MDPKTSDVVVLACGGKKCCPEVQFLSDGRVAIEDRGDVIDRVNLSADQAKLLRDALCVRYGAP